MGGIPRGRGVGIGGIAGGRGTGVGVHVGSRGHKGIAEEWHTRQRSLCVSLRVCMRIRRD